MTKPVIEDQGPEPNARVRVVVIGAGISGLAAAWRLSRTPGTEVIVLEGSAQVGGKLRLGEVGGLAVDVGAESVLARRPEAVALITEVGLGSDLVHPVATTPLVLARGVLHPLPTGTVMGVPSSWATLPGLAGLLTTAEVERVAAEPTIDAPALQDDIDVGSWVAGRMGRAVVDRLVESLLGGVYAGPADGLSLQATVPALWQRAKLGGALLADQAAAPAPQMPSGGPIFAGLRGGVGRLAGTLAERLTADGVQVRTGATVRGLRRRLTGWRLEIGSASAPEFLDADAVILAVPPAPAARLLAADVPLAAAQLSGIETASVAVVAAAIPADQLTGLASSGLLIPPVEGTAIKAATFSSAKWDWISGADDPLVVRLSMGRAGEELTLQRTDEELTALALGDLATVLGRSLRPIDTQVVRWGGGLPQYAVGHLARIERLRSAVAAVDGLAICGAVLDGVGVAACVAAADRAVADLLDNLRALSATGRRAGETINS
ncbi:MAG TPA: protoporphyrinogen oxidase [Kineosporiaceae bacterium]|nr:protoporphyrinogen oxidase [Kineosporiaceae bacterium]